MYKIQLSAIEYNFIGQIALDKSVIQKATFRREDAMTEKEREIRLLCYLHSNTIYFRKVTLVIGPWNAANIGTTVTH